MVFLVDANLVLLQPSMTEGELKYDMRIIANRVEYFDLMRDRAFPFESPAPTPSQSPLADASDPDFQTLPDLRDSLWYFDGNQVHCWIDVVELFRSASSDNTGGILSPVTISTDFHPSSIVLKKGLILGMESELTQRRDVSFASFRLEIRVSIVSLPIQRFTT